VKTRLGVEDGIAWKGVSLVGSSHEIKPRNITTCTCN
jgi:hypothetical protein